MNPLITPSWLNTHQSDPQIVVIDATLSPVGLSAPIDVRGRYGKAHIPNALFFDLEENSDH